MVSPSVNSWLCSFLNAKLHRQNTVEGLTTKVNTDLLICTIINDYLYKYDYR